MNRFAPIALLITLFLLSSVQGKQPVLQRHNVVMVVVNDVGSGDLACYGNRLAVTPNIDALFHQSQRAENYHSYPISAPTWASALTGRIAEKTGVRRNYGGLQYPRKEDLLVSQMLLKAGYKTGFFGRWPFGDCYPYRAQDRGFAATLTTGAGGIGQPGDLWGNSSVNPNLRFNGKVVHLKGYMVDVIFDTAIKFIDKNRNDPFFVVIAPNEAGIPYEPDSRILEAFKKRGIPERQAAFYAQLAMVDLALGRLTKYLKSANLVDNTVLIFTSTSGGIGGNIAGKYNGRTGELLEGGHRTIFWMRLPKLFKEDIGFQRICYCADIAPTILELANVEPYDEQRLDGMSLVSGFTTGGESMPHRKVVVNVHRGEFPVESSGSVVMHDQWRLIDGARLYNLEDDPLQEHPREFDKPGNKNVLAAIYKQWYNDVKPYYEPDMDCTIPLLQPNGTPVELTCYDWRGSNDPPLTQRDIAIGKKGNGYWLVEVPQSGTYEFRLSNRPFNTKHAPLKAGVARVQIGKEDGNVRLSGTEQYGSVTLTLKKGKYKLQTWIIDGASRISTGAYYVEVIKK